MYLNRHFSHKIDLFRLQSQPDLWRRIYCRTSEWLTYSFCLRKILQVHCCCYQLANWFTWVPCSENQALPTLKQLISVVCCKLANVSEQYSFRPFSYISFIRLYWKLPSSSLCMKGSQEICRSDQAPPFPIMTGVKS